jgi:hypothetical protein
MVQGVMEKNKTHRQQKKKKWMKGENESKKTEA